MKRAHKTGMAATLAMGFTLCAGNGWAQTAPTPEATPTTTDDGVEVTLRTIDGQRVYVARDPIICFGEVSRPYPFTVAGRSAHGYSAPAPRVSFVREILAVTRRGPL